MEGENTLKKDICELVENLLSNGIEGSCVPSPHKYYAIICQFMGARSFTRRAELEAAKKIINEYCEAVQKQRISIMEYLDEQMKEAPNEF